MISSVAGAVGPGQPRKEITPYTGIPLTVIRWDAETFDVTVPWYTDAGFQRYFPPSTSFDFRKPELWDNGQLYGAGVDTAAIVDLELAVAKNSVNAWAFDWYKPDALIDPPDKVASSQIMQYHDAYQASILKQASGVKFCYMIQWNQYNYLSGKYIAAFNTWFNTMLADPMYQLVQGKRLVLLYNDAGASGWAGNLTIWNNFKTAVGGNIFGAAVNSAAVRSNLGLQAIVVYGPNSSLPSSTGQDPWTAQATRDAGTWGAVPGAQKAISLTPVQDRRPFAPTTRYVDLPTRPQLLTHVQNGMAVPGATFAYIYAGSEITEGGNPYDAGLYDVLRWARGGYKEKVYTYETDCHTAATTGNNVVILTGTGWTYIFPVGGGVQGAYHNDEMECSTAGSSVKLNNHDRMISCDVIGSTAPGRGTATLRVDGVDTGTIDFDAPAAVSVTLATVSFADDPPIAHTVEVVCDGTGVIRTDSFRVTYQP